jgi:IPT/TIG domain/PASTA domain
VTITGADFEKATAVNFGAAPATAYTVDSEGRITATAPPHAAGPAAISVSTIAGTGTSSQAFTYDGPPAVVPPPSLPATCKVPRLKGKSLEASRRSSRAADCRLGKVTKRKGITAKSGKVKVQSPKPGRVVAAGTRVGVTLG